MSLAKLPVHEVEEGRDHPFVVALVKELTQRHAAQTVSLENLAAAGATYGHICAQGGRCVELREVLRMIRDAKGVE